MIDSSETKNNKARSIQASPAERQFVPKVQNKNKYSISRADIIKSPNRRNFETTVSQDQNIVKRPDVSTFRPGYKRRTFTTASTTVGSTAKPENGASRFKNIRKTPPDTVTAKTRRPFATRSTTEHVPVALSESTTRKSAVKKIPPTRGNFRPKTVSKELNDDKDDGEENYPEHFKQLLKNKEVNTQQNDRNVIKKPVRAFRPTSTSERPVSIITSSVKPKSNVLFPTRQNRFLSKPPTTSTESPSTSTQSVTVAAKRPLRTRSRPTERTKVNIGSTLQEPPTVKQSTPIYATKSPVAQESETYEDRIITQDDGLRQIDPPISEYIPRTNPVSEFRVKKIFKIFFEF